MREYFNINLHKPLPWKCLCICGLLAAIEGAEPRPGMGSRVQETGTAQHLQAAGRGWAAGDTVTHMQMGTATVWMLNQPPTA